MKQTIKTCLFPIAIALHFHSCNKDKDSFKADVVIYGGTSAAVIAAVEVAQSGKSVIVVSPDNHLGGLTSGGLGYTDSGNTSAIGGLARDFYHKVWLHYNESSAWKPNCTGDNKLQAYCFRMCMSNHPENRVPFAKPEGYDPAKYELLARVFDSGWNEWFAKYDMIPNRKTDTNNHGPLSTDFIGMNYDYPEASYARRKEIIKAHEDYQKGLLYFVSTDERVPETVRNRMQECGLAKDEFVDNGHWPHQLYIREARRMIGEYVTTENDVLRKRQVPEPVGMGSYTLDSHNIQRFVTEEGYVQNEGDVGVKAPKPYQISFGSIIPKEEECINLLVPVFLYFTHNERLIPVCQG